MKANRERIVLSGNKRVCILMLLILLQFVISSCLPFLGNQTQLNQGEFENDFLVGRYLDGLELLLDEEYSERVTYGQLTKLTVRNLSQVDVMIELPESLRLFVYLENEWHEIENTVSYISIEDGSGWVIPSVNNDSFTNRATFGFNPDSTIELANDGEALLRVVVTAIIVNNSEYNGDQVYSYIDTEIAW